MLSSWQCLFLNDDYHPFLALPCRKFVPTRVSQRIRTVTRPPAPFLSTTILETSAVWCGSPREVERLGAPVIRQQQLRQPKPHLPPSFFELPWYALQILWTVSLVLTRANIQRHHDGNVASNNRHDARTSPRVTTHPTLARSRPVSPYILVACETQPLGLMRPA
jgi:hypothetical protein